MLKVLGRTQHQGPAVRKDLANGARSLIPCAPLGNCSPRPATPVQTAIVHKSLRGGRGHLSSSAQQPVPPVVNHPTPGAKLATDPSEPKWPDYMYTMHTHAHTHTRTKTPKLQKRTLANLKFHFFCNLEIACDDHCQFLNLLSKPCQKTFKT